MLWPWPARKRRWIVELPGRRSRTKTGNSGEGAGPLIVYDGGKEGVWNAKSAGTCSAGDDRGGCCHAPAAAVIGRVEFHGCGGDLPVWWSLFSPLVDSSSGATGRPAAQRYPPGHFSLWPPRSVRNLDELCAVRADYSFGPTPAGASEFRPRDHCGNWGQPHVFLDLKLLRLADRRVALPLHAGWPGRVLRAGGAVWREYAARESLLQWRSFWRIRIAQPPMADTGFGDGRCQTAGHGGTRSAANRTLHLIRTTEGTLRSADAPYVCGPR